MLQKRLFFIGLVTIAIAVVYFLAMPPRVVSVFPQDESSSLDISSPLIIKFNKPVERQKIIHSIAPEVYGEWKFEDPLIKNHLFRTMVFTPAVALKPNTIYKVMLGNITSSLSFGYVDSFSFSFTTAADGILNVANSQNKKNQITLIKIPFDWQDSPLSCEAASLKMGLASRGVNISEKDIMEKIGYDKTIHRDNIWGNPNEAFVGDINGRMCTTGYGVYGKAVAKAANHWRPAEYFSNWTLNQLISEIKLGNPVIFWGVLPVGHLTDCSWYTPQGEYIKAFKETHVRLVVGFIGDPENPSTIIIKDPLQGDLYWPTAQFLTNWKVYDYNGVAIR